MYRKHASWGRRKDGRPYPKFYHDLRDERGRSLREADIDAAALEFLLSKRNVIMMKMEEAESQEEFDQAHHDLMDENAKIKDLEKGMPESFVMKAHLALDPPTNYYSDETGARDKTS